MNKEIGEYKQELIGHLKGKEIDGIAQLWGEAKSYYKSKGVHMGGSYASPGDYINVILNIAGNLERFIVKIEDCK